MLKKKLIQRIMISSIILGMTVGGLARDTWASETGGLGAGSVPISIGTYVCTDGDCCECSSVLGSAIRQIISRNRFAPSVANYSGGNFKDDVREGIHKITVSGSDYDFELVKYEMVAFINNYFDDVAANGKSITLYVKEADSSVRGYKWITQTVPWSKENAMAAFVNAYQQKFDESSDASTARQQAANIWNNEIVKYISCFNKAEITMDDIRDILKNLGIDVGTTMTLEDIGDQLEHKHNGTTDECECRHVCSKKRRLVIQDSVHTGNVGVYNHYILAKVTSSDPLLSGILADEIKIGVENIGTLSAPFYVVGECVCRLGAEPIIIPAVVTPIWTGDTNIIQPEALTNFGIEIKFDKKVKDVSYTLDFSGLMSDKLNGDKIIEKYDLANAIVRVFKVETIGGIVSTTEVSTAQYTTTLVSPIAPVLDSSKIVITFNHSTSTTPFYAEAGSKYQIKMYVPTTLGREIQYGLKPLENTITSDSYIAKIVGDPGTPAAPGRKVINLSTELIATVRICEAQTILGVFYDEVYNDTPSVISKNVAMNYSEIAKIN